MNSQTFSPLLITDSKTTLKITKAVRCEELPKAKAKKIYINDNLSTLDRIVLCFAEFLGTGMLVFIGCMGCANMGSVPEPMKIAFAFGLAITIAVQCFGHISGSHINPAVTVAAVILGHTPVMHIPLYFIGQILGGIGGFALLKAVSPVEATEPVINGTVTHICSPGPLSSDLHRLQGVGVEFALTFILVLLCAAVWDCRNTDKVDSLSIRLGLAVAVLAMVGGSYTGANMNPARSFGPALLNGDWDDWWVSTRNAKSTVLETFTERLWNIWKFIGFII